MKNVFFFVCLALLCFSCSNKDDAYDLKLKVEYESEPINIDVLEPRFSWQLPILSHCVSQKEYKILVAENPKYLKDSSKLLWNSAWVKSDKNIFINYKGQTLQSGKDYYWQVSIKTKEDLLINSYPSIFSMGLLKQKDWKAKWIAMTEATNVNNRPRSILLRKEFSITSKPEKSKIFISGLGNYILYINGEKVGNDMLTPGWTDYRKRVQYQAYDISKYLKKGPNAVGIMLGNMWWSSGLGWQKAANVYSNGPLMGIAQITIDYKSGKKDTIISDENWKASYSPSLDNSLYNGEIWDARLEIPLWSEPGLEDSKWSEVTEITIDSITLSSQKGPEIRIRDELLPVSVKEVKPGIYVYDMGVNMVGITRFSAMGENGDTIIQSFAELLHEDGTVAQENLRSANPKDYYIMKGLNRETWQPHFTYHGFRYVQIEGLKTIPEIKDLVGLRFYSSAPVTGNFECSNEMINKIWANILNGQKGNLMSVPTDCPQRDERLGWTGDAQIFAPTACYNMNMAQFFAKWERDITDSQNKEGYTCDVNPAIVVSGPAKAAWGDAICIIPWHSYQFYGDKAILKDNYEGMKAWVEYMHRKSVNNIYWWASEKGQWEGYGDWIAVEKSPVLPISQAYYFYSTEILSKSADVLGYADDAIYYSSLADKIKNAFNEEYFDSKNINYPGKTQTANLLPYAFGLCPDQYKEKIAKNVADDVLMRGKHPSTGFLGTSYLLPALSDNDEHQLAFETVINEDYPSWGYMVKNGATSMWELWNSDSEPPEGMNSRNHFALGSVGEWFYAYLAGIKPLIPGFKKILIAPMPANGLDWVNAKIESPYGKIISKWEKTENHFKLDVSIPPNSSALIKFPKQYSFDENLDEYNIFMGDTAININNDLSPKEIIKFEITEHQLEIEVCSGDYQFSIEKINKK